MSADRKRQPRTRGPSPFRRPWNSNERLFGGPNVLFFGYARTALLYGLELLEIGPGDKVLVPSYVCQAVLAPFSALGVEIVFYPVREYLHVDLDRAAALCDTKTRALLTVNYFGFPQDYAAVASLCRQRGLRLIEDNAHGFLSGDAGGPLGRHGDIAICSFRKHLVIPNGAALIVNNASAWQRRHTIPVPSDGPGPMSVALQTAVKAVDLAFGGHLTALWRSKASAARPAPALPADGNVDIEETDIEPFRQSCSRLSMGTLRLLNVDHFRQAARRRLARRLRQCLTPGEEVWPIRTSVEPAVVPQALPVLAAHPERYVAAMRDRTGIRVGRWPKLPRRVREDPERYPAFYRQVVTIPLAGEYGLCPR